MGRIFDDKRNSLQLLYLLYFLCFLCFGLPLLTNLLFQQAQAFHFIFGNGDQRRSWLICIQRGETVLAENDNLRGGNVLAGIFRGPTPGTPAVRAKRAFQRKNRVRQAAAMAFQPRILAE